jgi:hypothetical protein
MNRIRIGDMVAFRHTVIEKAGREALAAFRARVTGIAGEWLFLEEQGGRQRVMPIESMCRVAPNGAVLELV